MGFSAGMSSSSSSSNAQSTDESSSASVSGGFGVSDSQDSVAFEDIFARMFGGAEGAAGGLDPSMLTEAANSLFSSGQDFMSGISDNAGANFLQDRLSSDNGVLQEQIDLLGSDLGDFFNEELLPGISSQAVHGGQLGGGRQGVAQTGAVREVSDQFTRGSTALRSAEQSQRDQIAQGMSADAISGAGTAFAGLGDMAGIADMGFSAGMAPFERLAAILGGPTVLNNSSSTSADWADAWSESFGQSTADSKSKSSSASFGFSDRRLKRHITRIGTVMGHAWYRWQFVWGEWSTGVMADEVPAEFVTLHPSGFAVVNYGALLDG